MLLEDGSLERYMLKFLLQHDLDLIRILGTYDVRIECVPLFYGFGLFQGEAKEIKEASQIFDEFHKTTKPFVLSIILGVVNHWNLLIAFKRDQHSKPLLIFLDSRNIEVLDIDEFEIPAYVEQRDQVIRQLTGRDAVAPFFKNMLKTNLYDVRNLIYTLEDVIYNEHYDIKQLYTKRTLHNVLKNFSRLFEYMLSPKPPAGDDSRNSQLKSRFLELTDQKVKSDVQEYLPYVLN